MWNRVLPVILALGGTCVPGPQASAAVISIQLFPLTGEVRFTNRGLGPVPIAFYSIFSPNGALENSPAVWKSIADNYDLSGNRLVDAINNWNKISATTTDLSEGVVANPGGNLPATRAISFGRIWDALQVSFPDLTFDVREPNGQQVGVTVEYTLDGDYSGDGRVDFTDYNLFWRPTFGSTTSLLADGNLNGIVDAADYVVWRNNLGLSIAGPPFGGGAGSLLPNAVSVPEPATAGILLIFAGIVLGCAKKRYRGCARYRLP
jgi:hypothetical protein